MRKLTYPDQEESCKAAVTDSAWIKTLPAVQALYQRMREAWLAAAEKSLACNASTFALLSVAQTMSATGMVAAL